MTNTVTHAFKHFKKCWVIKGISGLFNLQRRLFSSVLLTMPPTTSVLVIKHSCAVRHASPPHELHAIILLFQIPSRSILDMILWYFWGGCNAFCVRTCPSFLAIQFSLSTSEHERERGVAVACQREFQVVFQPQRNTRRDRPRYFSGAVGVCLC